VLFAIFNKYMKDSMKKRKGTLECPNLCATEEPYPGAKLTGTTSITYYYDKRYFYIQLYGDSCANILPGGGDWGGEGTALNISNQCMACPRPKDHHLEHSFKSYRIAALRE
jgi:hypothetical protein